MLAAVDIGHIRTLEELALAAWPAHMTVLDDGWVIRLTGGYTKRANSVTVLTPSTRGVADKITNAESLFIRQSLTPIFRLTALADPGLEAILDERGYRRAEESVVMVAPLANVATTASSQVIVSDGVSPAWVAAYAQLQHINPPHTVALQRMMAAIATSHATAQIVADGTIIGFGLGVVDRGIMGVFEVLTHPSARRQGIARQIMTALMGWGRANGAGESYLQVVGTNAAAIQLYDSLGYQDVYRYWYRIGG